MKEEKKKTWDEFIHKLNEDVECGKMFYRMVTRKEQQRGPRWHNIYMKEILKMKMILRNYENCGLAEITVETRNVRKLE